MNEFVHRQEEIGSDRKTAEEHLHTKVSLCEFHMKSDIAIPSVGHKFFLYVKIISIGFHIHGSTGMCF